MFGGRFARETAPGVRPPGVPGLVTLVQERLLRSPRETPPPGSPDQVGGRRPPQGGGIAGLLTVVANSLCGVVTGRVRGAFALLAVFPQGATGGGPHCVSSRPGDRSMGFGGQTGTLVGADAGDVAGVTTPAPAGDVPRSPSRIPAGMLLVVFGFLVLLGTELALILTIPGINYAGADGKAAQAVILATLEFARPFHISNPNPLEGMGSQMMPMNVWANPAYWPFAFFDRQVAAQLSGLIAFGCYALACYAMARCFDVPRLPSIAAAQLSLICLGLLPWPSYLRLSTFPSRGWPWSMRPTCSPLACSRGFRPSGRRSFRSGPRCSRSSSTASIATRYGRW